MLGSEQLKRSNEVISSDLACREEFSANAVVTEDRLEILHHLSSLGWLDVEEKRDLTCPGSKRTKLENEAGVEVGSSR